MIVHTDGIGMQLQALRLAATPDKHSLGNAYPDCITPFMRSISRTAKQQG